MSDIDDIDDALLALAGDASSEEEDNAPAKTLKESSGSPNRKPSSKPATRTGKKMSRRQNDSEDEGEV